MKKAQTNWFIFILIILAIVALVSAGYWLKELSEAVEGDIEDEICRNSNQLRGSTTPLGYVGARPKSTKLCGTQHESIYANDFSKCDPEFEDMMKKDEIEALRMCAAHQIAQLVWRCWWMGGEGGFGAIGSWKCFTAKIVINQYGGEKSNYKVEDNLRRQLREKLGCGEEWIPVKDRLIGEVLKCESTADYIADKLMDKLLYNAYIDYYRDINYSEEIASYQTKINNINSEISTILENNIQEKFKGEDVTVKVCREYKIDCQTSAGEDYDKKCCETYEEQKVLDNTFEAALTIGSKLPEIGSIKEEDIKWILDNKNNTIETRKYEPYHLSKFKVLGEFEMNPNTLAEIGFCAPPVEIGEGPLARMQCNLLTGQEVQLGSGGTVGQTREGSPYCQVFNAFNKIGVIEGLQKFCETRSKQL